MKLKLAGHDYDYAATQMLLALLPDKKLLREPIQPGDEYAISSLFVGEKLITASCKLCIDGKAVTAVAKAPVPGPDTPENDIIKLRQRLIKQSIFRAYCSRTGKIPPWGSLSGVRPTKLATRFMLEGGSAAGADKMLKNTYSVTEKRRRLCVQSAQRTVAAINSLKDDEISLYVGIPFCPTRCTYCSFVSHSIERSAHLLEPYLEALYRELEAAAQALDRSGKKLRTIYMGGGTPTTLSTPQMKALIEKIYSCFDLSRLTEFTVEGGRPDTLDPEKLKMLKDMGVSRVSVNPQTMIDHVLELMGRSHSAQQTRDAMGWALAQGFDAVNADMIAGLPGDDLHGFCRSMDEIIALGPENITVHTLALKKGSELTMNGGAIPAADQVEKMLDYAESTLRAAGYSPYYLYRQKYMAGSFENVGWTKPGKDNLYNIIMMEELHSVLSCGGAGSTKVILPDGKLVRHTNPKYPLEYIRDIDKIVSEKANMIL